MFLRALSSRGFLVNAAIVGVCCCFWFYQLNKMQTKVDRLESPENQISLSQDQLSEIPEQSDYVLAITDYRFLGQPFEKDGNHFQLLGPENANEATLDPASLVVARSHILEGKDLREMIRNSKGGTWYSVNNSDEDAPAPDSLEDTLSHPEYPNLNLAEIHHVGYINISSLSNFTYILWAIIATHIIAIPASLYFQMRSEVVWVSRTRQHLSWRTAVASFEFHG